MDDKNEDNKSDSYEYGQRRRPIRATAAIALAKIVTCDSERLDNDDSSGNYDMKVKTKYNSPSNQNYPRTRKRCRDEASSNQFPKQPSKKTEDRNVLFGRITGESVRTKRYSPNDVTISGSSPTFARRKIKLDGRKNYQSKGHLSTSIESTHKSLSYGNLKEMVISNSPATIITRSSSSIEVADSERSLTSFSQETTKLRNNRRLVRDFNVHDLLLATCTVDVPSTIANEDEGLDADIKRALKLSLQTYDEETRARQLLMEAEYSLASSQFGRKASFKCNDLNGSSVEAGKPMHSETLPPIEKATNTTLAQIECSSVCSCSSLTITDASSSSTSLNKSTDNTLDLSNDSENQPSLPPFSQKEFEDLWNIALPRLGFKSVEEIESGKFLRNANSNVKYGKTWSRRSRGAGNILSEHNRNNQSRGRKKCAETQSIQTRAMYGRTNFGAMKKIIDMTNLSASDIFLDIGHGIGNTCLQAAFTVGCEARGIEVVPQRCMISKFLTETMMEQLKEIKHSECHTMRKIGKIDLREGSVVDPSLKTSLSSADVVLVNNSHDIFGVRSGDVQGRPTVDSYVAGIFSQLKPGARMVTFYPLLSLGRSLSEENERRRKNGMEESLDASFFTCEYKSLGKDAVSWSYVKEINVYMYTRVKQRSPHGEAIFLCSNKNCSFGNCNGTAVVNEKTGLLRDECVYCGSKRLAKTRRC